MEKIIAVVVMIAIVIGLIATAVMPTVQQMNEQGQTATNDLANLSATMGGNTMQGTTVKADIKANITKFSLATDALTDIYVFIEGDTTNASLHLQQSDYSSNLATTLNQIPDSALFVKSTDTYASGKIKTVTYKIQVIK